MAKPANEPAPHRKLMAGDLRFLFTAPRYHTNQHYAMKSLLDGGHEVAFFALRRGQSETYSSLTPTVFGYSRVFELLLGVKGIHAPEYVGNNGFPPIVRFWKRVHQFKPDAVVIRNPNSPFGMLAAISARLSRAAIVFYTQGPKFRRMGRLQRWSRQALVRLFDAQWITPVLGKPQTNVTATLDRVHYVPFVVPPGTAPSEKEWCPGGTVRILSVGKFEQHKNHELLLRAFQKVSPDRKVRLALIGECVSQRQQQEKARLESLAESLGVAALVTFKTNLTFEEVQAEYALHDLFVLVSQEETASVSNLEAMAHSLPVIMTNTSGTACYIDEGMNGFVIENRNLDALVQKLALCLEFPDRLQTMGARSYALVLSNHAPAQYERTLAQIVTARSTE